jgi:LCP family protein required for cell wall assembly
MDSADPTAGSTAGDDAHIPTERPEGGRRRARKRLSRGLLRGFGVFVLALAMVSGLAVAYSVRHFQDNIETIDYEKQLSNRPEAEEFEGPKKPLNILVMGIDSRAGKGNAIDGESGEEASDTTILLHLSADRKRAYGVSIPRDSLVDRPDCKDEDLNTIPGESYVQWNRAYAAGGAGCTMQQFEQLTGVRLDHSVVVDFNGFQGMVDAIGGVEVCVPEEVNDEAYGITLKAGTYDVTGLEALSYVRERHGVGDGSDIGRMQRQQAFIASMVNKAMSADTLANPVKLYKFLNAATKSLKMDEDLADIGQMAALGGQFKSIGMDNVKFFTIPWGSDPDDPNRVLFAPEAEQVWEYIRTDEEIPTELLGTAITAKDPPNKDGEPKTEEPTDESPSEEPTIEPSDPATGPSSEEIAAAREQVGLCT